jgi:hypothetical protein
MSEQAIALDTRHDLLVRGIDAVIEGNEPSCERTSDGTISTSAGPASATGLSRGTSDDMDTLYPRTDTSTFKSTPLRPISSRERRAVVPSVTPAGMEISTSLRPFTVPLPRQEGHRNAPT